jgi:hypothetical protein
MEKIIEENNFQSQSDIDQLKDQHRIVIINVRKNYEDILDEKSIEMGN